MLAGAVLLNILIFDRCNTRVSICLFFWQLRPNPFVRDAATGHISGLSKTAVAGAAPELSLTACGSPASDWVSSSSKAYLVKVA